MKKTMLRIASVVSLLAMGLTAQAQAINLLGGRFVVNAEPPAGGQVTTYEVANDGSGGTDQWGRAIDSIWIEVPLAKAFASGDSLGCGPITTDVAGKFALVRRGSCTFTQKAAEAQTAGAIGVIIANNAPGAGVAGMAFSTGFGTVDVPVIMVTKELGDLLYAALNAGEPVTISLSQWGFGVPNDLTFVPQSFAMFHALGIPYKQLQSDNGNPEQYNNYLAAIVANTGTADQTGIVLSSQVNFTPDGGSTTVISEDSIAISGTFQTSDSIAFLANSGGASQIHVNSPGRLDFNYSVHGSQPDDYPGDNTGGYSVMVTQDIFSKGRLDPVTMQPRVVGGVRFASASPMVWGPLYYVAKGGDTVKQVQFAVADGVTDPHSLEGLSNVQCRLYRWNDANEDGVVTIGELEMKGVGIYTFTSADSNYTICNMDITSDDGESMVTLEGESWYYVALEVPGEFYLAYDQVNYYTRVASTDDNADYNQPAMEFWSGQYANGTLVGADPADSLMVIPFYSNVANNYNLDSFGFNDADYVPVAVLRLGEGLSVKNTVNNFSDVSLFPNPVRNELNVQVKLNNQAQKLHYLVTDVLGRTIQTGNLYNVQDTRFSVNTAYLAAGTYYLVMTDGKQTFSKKFVKEGK